LRSRSARYASSGGTAPGSGSRASVRSSPSAEEAREPVVGQRPGGVASATSRSALRAGRLGALDVEAGRGAGLELDADGLAGGAAIASAASAMARLVVGLERAV
jgi:hypothetical protein